MNQLQTERDLIALARSLAGVKASFSAEERGLFAALPRVDSQLHAATRALIEAGDDPLGEAFCQLRSSIDRRTSGAVYTPHTIVASMIAWSKAQGTPSRVVDPGCGSGRFLLAAAKAFPAASLVGVDLDPLAILMLRANAAVLGLSSRIILHCLDFRKLRLAAIAEATLYIGNPPYVRHHDIHADSKAWFATTAKALGFKASLLAGLHIHFFLKTRELASPGDFGAFITSAEWLDVNYGSVLRTMLADGLGGSALHVLAPESMPFANATTTGAITCFHVGNRKDTMTVRSVDSIDALGALDDGEPVAWPLLSGSHKWSTIVRSGPAVPAGFIELGELCRVHRGQVTGNNAVWIAGGYDGELPESLLTPSVTKARELIAAGTVLTNDAELRCVVDLPVDLDMLASADRKAVERFLKWARSQKADEGYIATYRRAWWSVGLRAPAPILCTYMARRAPAFVVNKIGAAHLNIAHGLYPREPMDAADLMALASYLTAHVKTEAGRTYAGGLTKFEPKELERIMIPPLQEIHADLDRRTTSRRRTRIDRQLPT